MLKQNASVTLEVSVVKSIRFLWFIILFQSRKAFLGVRYVNNSRRIETFHFLNIKHYFPQI